MAPTENLDSPETIDPCEEFLTDDNSLTPEAFRRLLSQYKRAGYESIETWHQRQGNLFEGISVSGK